MAKKKTKKVAKSVTPKKYVKDLKHSYGETTILTKRVKLNVVKKNTHEKFYDLFNSETKKIFENDDFKGYEGQKDFYKKLKIDSRKLEKFRKTGNENLLTKNEIQKINKTFAKLALKKNRELKKSGKKDYTTFSKKESSKQYTKYNFTLSNFFKPVKFPPLKREQFYFFRAGVHLFFQARNKQVTGLDNNPEEDRTFFYTTSNVPFSDYYGYDNYKGKNGYKKAHEKFFSFLKAQTFNRFPSLAYFKFNYFDVKIIDTKVESKITAKQLEKNEYKKIQRKTVSDKRGKNVKTTSGKNKTVTKRKKPQTKTIKINARSNKKSANRNRSVRKRNITNKLRTNKRKK